MERDKHEALLAELMGETSETRKTEILQELRTDYTGVLSEHEKLSSTNSQLSRDKEDLLIANSRLFRQNGIYVNQEEKDKKVEEIKSEK